MHNENSGFFTNVWDVIFSGYFIIATDGTTNKFLKYVSDTGSNEFVDSPKEATAFDIVLGSIIVKKLRLNFPKLEFSLQDINNAMFVHHVQNNTSCVDTIKRDGYVGEDANSDGTPLGMEEMRITRPGIKYYMAFPSVNNPDTPIEIEFLGALIDAKWHNKNEFAKVEELPDLIAAALQNNLIEMR